MSETELQQLNARLDRIESVARLYAKDVLRVEEAALFTGFSVGYIYNLTSRKAIPYYKQGQAVFFKKADLEAWMTEHRIASEQELTSAAATYTTLKRKSH
jgi:excisionase family DNA binding protein